MRKIQTPEKPKKPRSQRQVVPNDSGILFSELPEHRPVRCPDSYITLNYLLGIFANLGLKDLPKA